MGSLVLTLTEEYHKQHVGTETETVAEVLDKHTEVDDKKTVGHVESQEYVCNVRNGDGKGHRP